MKSVLVMLKLPVICLASQWHWGLSLGLIWDQPGEFWLNWTKPNTWSDWHKLLLFNQKVKAISLKCLVSVLWEKSWLLRKDGFFYIDPVIVHPLEPLKHIGIVFSDEGTYVHILWKYSLLQQMSVNMQIDSCSNKWRNVIYCDIQW